MKKNMLHFCLSRRMYVVSFPYTSVQRLYKLSSALRATNILFEAILKSVVAFSIQEPVYWVTLYYYNPGNIKFDDVWDTSYKQAHKPVQNND